MKARRVTSTHEALRRTGAPREGQQKAKASNGVRQSFSTFNAVVDGHIDRMGRSEALLWLMLWRFEDRKTGLVRVSMGTMAKLMGMSRRSVVTLISSLTEQGYLNRVTRGSSVDHSANVYRLTLPRK